MKTTHMNSDNFAERGMQTFNDVLKTKDVQVTAAVEVHAECQASLWEILDTDQTDEHVDGAENEG
jgi:hypothetical protein